MAAALPSVLLDLPSTPGCAALRSALMALRVPPQVLSSAPEVRRRELAPLSAHPGGVAFIDISHRPLARATGLVDLFSTLPPGPARQRVVLTRLAAGHVSPADRRWVQEMGFADLLPEFEVEDCEGALRTAVDWAARSIGLDPLPAAELARFARASVSAGTGATPRAVIRARTGLSAEGLAARLAALLDIEDRRWHLRTYPRCFVGREAVQRIVSTWRCTPAAAVEVGQALGQLGLLAHVVQEHPFLDDNLFYRLAWSGGQESAGLAAFWDTLSLPGGVQAQTRHYLGKAYPDCWLGRQAVDLLCERHRLDRVDAWLALHRLMQFGLFEHVTREHPFIDGEFFYRFATPAGRTGT
ncbi:MAG: hypothetical protein KIT17_22105 [Rubrivivax sp.]|nr:hypothetical protein [Rubrivivax sp.]